MKKVEIKKYLRDKVIMFKLTGSLDGIDGTSKNGSY